MFNNFLIINGYLLYISNHKNHLTGVYVKGTDTRIDDLIEVDNQIIEEFKIKRENIVKEIINGRYFIAKYDFQTSTFKAQIRKKTYKGPYAEEVVYNTIYKSNSSENLFLSLNSLEKNILEKHKIKLKSKQKR